MSPITKNWSKSTPIFSLPGVFRPQSIDNLVDWDLKLAILHQNIGKSGFKQVGIEPRLIVRPQSIEHPLDWDLNLAILYQNIGKFGFKQVGIEPRLIVRPQSIDYLLDWDLKLAIFVSKYRQIRL